MSMLDTNSNLEQELQQVTQQARAACATNGDLSSECAAAWDAAEEIQAAISHRKGKQSAFDRYCEERPDALECRVYDV
ncbi:Calvin cycle protein CP12 [Leptolyngbya sp. FACHB-36]|uniref:Calvin cycle protein CP12 n=1 Tax=Leptolyngbya sp. FACHB-36 TaxID=2692808 RepID=UPI001680212E|nr:Calvin cycle protein CP12 [Leptolyngbya sp. FACHB-36]MBD2019707.1 Calvin cycle protein CP12 [Leptolyngbya sp. FACHB-36]